MATNVESKWKKGDEIIRRYEVIDIKAGGMGIVYICYDRRFKKKVALKTLQQQYLNSKTLSARFMWEAETWVRLEKHQNIVQAEYVTKIEDLPFICLEYIEGSEKYGAELKGWIRKGGIDLPGSINFALQFCNGMVHASVKFKEMRRPFIYRDVKPANIMVTADKTVKITDFGLVKLALEPEAKADKKRTNNDELDDFAMTQTGTIVGTPYYMSPEQWLNKELDERADIYAFGCVFYEMITGAPPFSAKNLDDIKELHLRATPKPIPDLPGKLTALIGTCLKKDREKRYSNFSVIRDELNDMYQSFTGSRVYQDDNSDTMKSWELINKGISLFNLKFYNEALECFNAALKLKASNPDAYRSRGSTFHALGRYDEAISDFKDSIRLNPKSAETYYNRGVTFFAAGRSEKAVDDYTKAIELDENYAEAYFNRGVVLRKLGKLDEAIEDYGQAIRVKPDYVKAYQSRGNAHFATGNYEEAAADYKKAYKLNRTSLDALFNLALTCEYLGKTENALLYWKLFLSETKNSPQHSAKADTARAHIKSLS
ncbi:MAG: tetratricopeptide repeat protein [Nitrospirae bacterium]|nr:tetratricopeptide repeat protein [Nitrospirota bacterium]